MHEPFIRHSVSLARQAREKGNNPFGACLVKDGEIILNAENTICSDRDPTKHAESNLVSLAAQKLDPETIGESTLYTSTEPCAMCAGAIYWSGVRRIVFGCSNHTLESIAGKGLSISSRAVLAETAKPIEIIGPILEEEAASVHQDYWSGKPR